MKPRTSALYRRTEHYRRGRSGLLPALAALLFAAAPLGVLLAVLPGWGFAIA